MDFLVFGKIRTFLSLDKINSCRLAGQCPLQESNNNTLKLLVAGKNTYL